jgi:phosphoribosylanthranilate isomerase
MWIKICGITSAAAVSAALAAGADALGFVFASSVRQLTPAVAAVLAQPVRGRARCVAVTLQPNAAEVREILAEFRPDVLQADAAALAALRLPGSLETLPVVRAAMTESLPPRLLFEGPASGSGTRGDWEVAQALARRTQLVLAGGLTAANVAEAIRRVAPFGVDVSSGVESRPGQKDPHKIEEFVARARAAAGAHVAPSEETT